MANRWCDFFAPGHAKCAKSSAGCRRFSGIGTALALLLATFVLASSAVAEPVAAPSSSPLSLPLPTFNLEIVAQDHRTTNKQNDKIKVGDRIKVRIAGFPPQAPGGAGLRLEVAKEVEAGLNERGLEILPKLGEIIKEPEFEVVPIKPGKLTIPTLTIFEEPRVEDKAAIGQINPFELDVLSVISPNDPKPTEMVPPQPPVGLPFPIWAVSLIVLGILTAITFAVWALVRWSRKKRAVKPLPVIPLPEPRPEDEVALEALLLLDKQKLMESGKYKLHYFGISEILKRYVGDRYRFDALESTTRELIAVLEHRGFCSRELIRHLENLFGKLDLVKFTDHIPQSDDGKDVMKLAREFVLLSKKPVPVPVPVPVSAPGVEAKTNAL